MLALGGNKIKRVPPGLPKTSTVHEWNKIKLADGDNIRITANGYKEGEKHLTNSSQHFITLVVATIQVLLHRQPGTRGAAGQQKVDAGQFGEPAGLIKVIFHKFPIRRLFSADR